MQDNELLDIWKSYDQKLNQVLSLNKEMVSNITQQKLKNTIRTMKGPKQALLVIGIPYTLFLYCITFIAFHADALFVTIGFGAISLIMTSIIIGYLYHLHLINQISNAQEIVEFQTRISELKISTFNLTRLAVIQLPFWSICWISLDALKDSVFLYGGVNLIVFLGLSYISYKLYKNLNINNTKSVLGKIMFSGREWDPIIKSSDILDQLKEYNEVD